MNQGEVATVLAAASAIDPTVPAPGGQVLSMWTAMLDDVPVEAGQSAVREYYRSASYREHKRTITPSDIYGHWRSVRDRQLELDKARAIADQRRAIEGAPEPVRSLSELFAMERAARRGEDAQRASEAVSGRRRVLSVQCPHCKVRPGVACVRYGGRPLVSQLGHPARLDAAGLGQETSD